MSLQFSDTFTYYSTQFTDNINWVGINNGNISKWITYLINNSTLYNYNAKYIGRLDLLSYDNYKTTDYWFILATINNVFDIDLFWTSNQNPIYLPSESAILTVTKNM